MTRIKLKITIERNIKMEKNIKIKDNIKRLNKKQIITIGIVVVIVLIVMLLAIFSSINNVPKKQQLQNDLIQEEFDGNVKIDDFTIISDEKYDNKYSAIVDVSYSKDNVKYNEKYTMTYSKYKDWQFYSSDDYDKEIWTKTPTAQPNIENFTKLCIEKLESKHHFYDYDSFTFNQEKSKIDVENGEVIYAFDASKNTTIENRAGTILFDIKFDYETGNWNVENITYSDSYKITYNFEKTWIGTLKCLVDSSWNDTTEKNVSFSITSFEKDKVDGTIKGEFIFDNKTYEMSGTITLPESNTSLYSNDKYIIEMTGENGKVCKLDGTLHTDGTLNISINRDYTGGDSGFYTYYKYDIFDGDLSIN